MDRLKYGMITNPSRDIVREIRDASRMGFDYVEIGMEIPEGHPDVLIRKRQDILRVLKAFRPPPIAHTPYWTDLWSDYDEVRHAWIRVCNKSIDAAASLGCVKLNIHLPLLQGMYKYVDVHKKRAMRNMAESLRELVRHARARKIKIVIENMPEVDTMRIKEFSYIMDRVPGLGAHVDVGHAFVEGGMPMVSRYMRSFRNRLEHVHFSDNTGLQDDHAGIGRGIIDYARVLMMLRSVKYDKTVSLEVFTSRKDLRESLKKVRALEEAAWQR